MKLINMQHEPGQGESVPMAACSNEYPYGLRVTLHQEQLEALGFKELPKAGTQMHIEAMAVVTRSSTEDPDADGDVDYVCVELQLTQLGAEVNGEPKPENKVERRAKSAAKLYGE